jgi:hypothetical protein
MEEARPGVGLSKPYKTAEDAISAMLDDG